MYRTILGTLPEVVHEISLIRSQLTEFGKTLEEAASKGIVDDPFSRTVFPEGSATVSESAKKLVEKLLPNELRDFEHGLQGKVRHICRGITAVCARPKEHGSAFLGVLDEQATRFLEVRIPAGMKGNSPDPERVEDLIERAAPAALGQGKPNVTFVGMREQNPALIRFVRESCPGDVRTVAATDELFVWREFQSEKVQAFQKLCPDPPANNISVYSRRDVNWIPLEAGENT